LLLTAILTTPQRSLPLLQNLKIIYTIDLNTGKATNIGSLTQKIIDFAIPTNPVAYAVDNSDARQIFDPNKPEPVSKAITGLQNNESKLIF